MTALNQTPFPLLLLIHDEASLYGHDVPESECL